MFLANENFPHPSIKFLRELGFEVKSIQTDFPGIEDAEVMQIASDLNLIILTFDSDYGELIFKYANANPPAVINFRDKGSSPESAGQTLKLLLENSSYQFQNTFTVVESESIRQRKY